MSPQLHEHLQSLCERFNEMPAKELATFDMLSKCFEPLLTSSARTHLNNWSRMSGIGKPTIITAINKYKIDMGYDELDETDDEHTPRMQTMFLWGNLFEEWIIKVGVKLNWWGVIDNSQQRHLVYNANGVEIDGHVDGILETPYGSFVFECKTLSPNYARTFMKEPNDDRGYLTQLALYSACTGLPGFWLILDKGTGLLNVVSLPQELADERVKRVDIIVPHINSLKTIEEAVNTISLPELKEDKFKRALTGRYTLPESMKYWVYTDVFYETYSDFNKYRKMTKYVEGERDKDEVIDILKSLGL
jgi:hypothetical protein